jgi:hypothetical protein
VLSPNRDDAGGFLHEPQTTSELVEVHSGAPPLCAHPSRAVLCTVADDTATVLYQTPLTKKSLTVALVQPKRKNQSTTLSNGYLGSRNDDERSEMR